MTYVTMTAGGSYGQRFEARNDVDARREATARGYTVLDIMDGDDLADETVVIIVVAD